MIALPPPGESIPMNTDTTPNSDNTMKDATKEDKPVKRNRNADPLFGHLGVKKTNRKRKPKQSLDQMAKERNEKNAREALIQEQRRKNGLSEDIPDNVEKLRAYLKEKMDTNQVEDKVAFDADPKVDEENGWSDPGDQDLDDIEAPATPPPKGESALEPGIIAAKAEGNPEFPDDEDLDYEDTLPSIDALSMDQQIALDRAKKYAMEQSVRNVLMNQEADRKEQQASDSHQNLMKQQALVYMCRVYIGSVYYEVREQHLRRAFSPFGPIKLVNMSLDPLTGKHKGFAFVEFELPEASQLAIEQMNGVLLCGRAIKIGRPTNMPQSMPIVESIVRESQKSSRIYVSCIHSDLTTDDIKSVFGAFGPIISIKLRPCAVSGNHAGYGFIEYETVQAANDAVQSMNLFDLGGQFLRVGKAMSPPEKDLMTGDAWKNPEELYIKKIQESANIGGVQPTVAVAAAKVTTELMQMENIVKKEEAKKEEAVKAEQMKPKREGSKFGGKSENIAPVTTTVPSLTVDQLKKQSEGTELDEAKHGESELRSQSDRQIMMQKLESSRNQDSRVLCLRNMIQFDDLDDDFEDEVKEECETKYGPVNEVLVYLEKQSEDEDAETIVKVFIEFTHTETTKIARSKLHGRWFGGHQIQAHFYNMGFYEVDDLSH